MLRRLVLTAGLALAAAPAAADPFVACVQEQLTELGFDPGPADGVMGRRTRAAWQVMRAGYEAEFPQALTGLPPLSKGSAVHWCRELPGLRYVLARYLPSRKAPVVRAGNTLAATALQLNYAQVSKFMARDMGMPIATRPGLAAADAEADMKRQVKVLVRELGWAPIKFTKPIRRACDRDSGYSAKAFPGMFFICWAKDRDYGAAWLRDSRRWLGPVIAHEYVHLWQAEIAGEYGLRKRHPVIWAGKSAAWLDEGAAELVREKYAAAKGYYQPETFQDLRRKALRTGLKLSQLRPLNVAFEPEAYDLALFAVRVLEARHGQAGVFEYWRKQGRGLSWQAAFQESFGMPVDEFEKELQAMLATVEAKPGKELSKRKKQ